MPGNGGAKPAVLKPTRPIGIAGGLRRLLGEDAVLAGGDVAPYCRDATEAENLVGEADAVCLPSRVEEVRATVEWCYGREIPIVPRGGGTGYAAGCVPDGGVVLSTERLNAVRSLEPLQWQGEFEAGVTTRRVQRMARENGLCFPVDPGAAEQSHLGGNIATNAGGPHAFKYGVTRAWVTGLEAVLAPGRVVRIGGAISKDVAGYDLISLIAGSEGTLGIVTAAHLRFIPAIESRYPVVGFYDTVASGCDALPAAMACGTVPAALEYLDGAAMRITAGAFPGDVPRDAALVLIAEADGAEAEAREGRGLLIEALRPGSMAVLAPATTAEIADLWRWREGVGIAVDSELGGKVSEDIVVPQSRLGEAIEGTLAIGRRHGLATCSWGHAGDGNLHSTFMFSKQDNDAVAGAQRAADDLFGLAIDLHGSISGEHGIGLVKRHQLRRQWPAEAVDLHRAIKREFDPRGLMNPGKKEP